MQFGVRAKARAGGVHRRELLAEQVSCGGQRVGIGHEQRGERPEGVERALTVGGRRHQPPPCVVLVAVGAGDDVDGAGVGGLLGGAKVGDAVVGTAVGCGVGRADGCADDGCAPGAAGGWEPCPAAARLAPAGPLAFAGFGPGFAAARAGVCAGVSAAGVGLPGAVVWLLAVCAGAVRANTIAKPTVASAPIWVPRQVSRPSRRKPASRACAGESS